MHSIEKAILALFNRHSATVNAPHNPLIIAYSGGLDSSVLLHAAHSLVLQEKLSSVEAIHVNHGLQSEADSWQQHCRKVCQQYDVSLTCRKLDLLSKNKLSELDARNARYQIFEENLRANQLIAFAHHLNDQAETLLFRLFRGTGLHGSKGIPESRSIGEGTVIRPLLKFSRSQLREYAETYQLQWIEDPSNQSDQYDRNFIRNKIIPLIQSRWHNVEHSLNQFSVIASEQSEILDQVAMEDLRVVANNQSYLSIEKLKELSESRQNNLLYFWIRIEAGSSASRTELQQVSTQLRSNESNALKIKVASGWCRRFNDRLYFCSETDIKKLKKPEHWDKESNIIQLANGIILKVESSSECVGLSQSEPLMLRPPLENEVVTFRPRSGGERGKPNGRNHSTELKKIYQELSVPPWERERLPLIYYDELLVAVPGVFVDQSVAVEQEGIVFCLK